MSFGRNCLLLLALAGCAWDGSYPGIDAWGPPRGTKPVYEPVDATLDCKQLADGVNGNYTEIQRIARATDDNSDTMYATGVTLFGVFALPAMIADYNQKSQSETADYARYVQGRIVALKETGKKKGCEKDPDFALALKPRGVNWVAPPPVSNVR